MSTYRALTNLRLGNLPGREERTRVAAGGAVDLTDFAEQAVSDLLAAKAIEPIETTPASESGRSGGADPSGATAGGSATSQTPESTPAVTQPGAAKAPAKKAAR